VTLFFQGIYGVEFVFDHPFLGNQFGDVVPQIIGEDTNETMIFVKIVFLGVLNGGIDDGPTGPTTEESLFPDQSPTHREGFLVFSLDPIIGHTPIDDPGDEIVTDSLH